MRLCLPLLLALSSAAQNPQPDPFGRTTPRGSLMGFLEAAQKGDYARAVEYLHPDSRQEDLARQLKAVIDRRLSIDLTSISDAAEGSLDDSTASDLERIGAFETARGRFELRLERVRMNDGAQVWLFSTDSLARVRSIYRETSATPLEKLLPEGIARVEFLWLPVWQWFALFLLMPLAFAVAWLVTKLFLSFSRPFVKRTITELDDHFVAITSGPLRLLLAVVLFHASMTTVGLPLLFRHAITRLELFLGIAAVAWFFTRLADLAAQQMRRRLVTDHRTAAVSVVPLGRRAAKALVIVLAVLAIADNLGFNVTALIAGLGVGGIAVALAAQKTLENLFGGVALIADQPVLVGDFCKFGDQMGTVEDIGLRSTRVRTLDRTLVTVPNSQFSSMGLENFAPREKIRFAPIIQVAFDTSPVQLRNILRAITELLLRHERIERDSARVRFVGFGDSSIRLEVFSYVQTADYGEFLAIQEELLLRIMEIVEAAGTRLAVPAQITFVRSAVQQPE
jgi:MscS family membrane protein